MSNDDFSFRWGIPMLDSGYTTVPNIFFDYYGQAGLSRQEFLLILHLSRYRYEREGSECRPSLGTVAAQMGYSGKRQVRKMLADLEKRGLLERHYRVGQPSILDFTNAAKAILKAAGQKGEELEDLPSLGDDPAPRNLSSGEGGTGVPAGAEPQGRQTTEVKREKKLNNNTVGDAECPEDQRQCVALLVEQGVVLSVARALARKYDPEVIRGWVRHVQRQQNVDNPAGLLVTCIRSGDPPPSRPVKTIHVPATWG
jgi:hypothetical protein